MLTKSVLSMLAVLALAAGMVACGGDDEPAGDAPAQQEEATATATPEATGTTAPETTGEQPSSEDLEAAVEACKQSVRDRTDISDDLKSDIEDICDEAKSGDPEDIKEATRKVCERVVEEQVPEGAQRDQALETCKTVTQ